MQFDSCRIFKARLGLWCNAVPLTLSLSPRRGEKFASAGGFEGTLLCSRQTSSLPLPEGEGWGEGKGTYSTTRCVK